MKLGPPLFEDAVVVVISDFTAGEAVPGSTPPLPTPGLNPLRNLILGFLGGSPITVGLGVAAAAAAAGSLGPIINDDEEAAELSLDRVDLLAAAAAEESGDGRSASTVAAGGDFVSGL